MTPGCAGAIATTLTATCLAALPSAGSETITLALAYQSAGPTAGKWTGTGQPAAEGLRR